MEFGKILKIEEVHAFKPLKKEYESYEGYLVKTDKTQIMVLVSDSQDCCEDFGYITTNDSLNDFIGSQINNVVVVDTALKSHDAIEYLDGGDAMFVNFETSSGTMQLVVYNSHNGYYGHTAKLIIGSDTVSEFRL